jgi:hypothetical protein
MLRSGAEFLLYQTEDGRTRVDVRFDGETAWLCLGPIAARSSAWATRRLREYM